MRYCIISDGDDEYYLCPIEKQKEALEIMEKIGEYWETLGSPDKGISDNIEIPSYLKSFENPFRLTFTDPRVE